jgi:hypothetical protein
MSRGRPGVVVGIGELRAKLRRLPVTAQFAVAQGGYAAMQVIMEEARALCPVEEGWMRASGFVARPSMTTRGTVTVNSGFGGASEEYVVRQHEDTSLSHPNGGQAKWFEAAIDIKWNEARRVLEAYTRTAVEGHGTPTPAKRVPEAPDEEMGPIKTSRHGRHG